jgi:hypothetical protein
MAVNGAEGGAIDIGGKVMLKGLVARAELNGRSGVVISFDAERGRFGVEVDGQVDPLAIKRVNLQPVAVSREQSGASTALAQGLAVDVHHGSSARGRTEEATEAVRPEAGLCSELPLRSPVSTLGDVRLSRGSNDASQGGPARPEKEADPPGEADICAEDGRAAIRDFLEEDEGGWLDMWKQLPLDGRRCLIRTVIPHLPVSEENTHCVCGCGDLRRDIDAILCPELNLEGLVEGPAAPPPYWPARVSAREAAASGMLQTIQQLERLTVSGSVHKVMKWHAHGSLGCGFSKVQWEHDKRDVAIIRRLQQKGLLPAQKLRKQALRDTEGYFLFFLGTSALCPNGSERGSVYCFPDLETATRRWDAGTYVDAATYRLLQRRQLRILQVLSLLADEFRTEWKRSHGGYSVSRWFTPLTRAERASARELSEAAVQVK